jgi:hypothetical protein
MAHARLARSVLLVAAALAVATAASARTGIPHPDLVVGAGGTFAVTGTPGGGGVSFSISPMWPVSERLRFGLLGYADDIGTTVVPMSDPNDGTPLGPSAQLHRWAWGAAWRAEADVWKVGRWAGGVSGAWGYWRIEDDRRGTTLGAGSAVGFVLGADARRPLGRSQSAGLALRYHRLSQDPHAEWRRVDRYASAALELRWAGPGRDD